MTIEQVSRQRLPSYSDVPEVVLEYAAQAGLRVSWQPSDSLSQPQLNVIGVFALDPEDIRKYDPEWYEANVGRARALQVQDGVFQRGDAALMVMPEERYEEHQDRIREIEARRARTAADFEGSIDEALRRFMSEQGARFPKSPIAAVPGSGRTYDDREAVSVSKHAPDDPDRRRAPAG